MLLTNDYKYSRFPIMPDASPNSYSYATVHDGLYTADATQRFVLGTKYETWDGRKFRYAKAGATALVQAYMNQSAVQESKMVEIAQTAYAQAVGNTAITVLCTTGSAAGEDDFSGGYLVCNKVSPAVLGDIYGIVSSKLQTTDTKLDLVLDTPWRNAMLATGEISLTYSRWFKSVVTPTATSTSCVNGVALCPVPIGYYYWSQVKGPCPLIVDTGDTVEISSYVGNPRTSAVAGACGPITTVTTEQLRTIWGRVMSIAAAGEPAMVDLMLE
jgi:hypothetical protein